MSKKLVAIATLTGCMIGAGMYGIPYAIMQSGFPLGLIMLVIICALCTLTFLYLGEIVLRTKGDHQLIGYAGHYLGEKGKIAMCISVAFGVCAALTAYLIGQSESFSVLLFNTPQYSLYAGIIVWAVMSLCVYQGMRFLKGGEELGLVILLILFIAIITLSWNSINVTNLAQIHPSNAFVPCGVILFAFLGFSAIPQIKRELGKEISKMKQVILIGNAIALCTYIVFTAIIIGMKGSATPPLATIALGKPFILLGILTMTTAYLANANAITESLRFDYHIKKRTAWLCVTFIPLICFIIAHTLDGGAFTIILGIGGAISGGLTATLILMIAPRAKEKNERMPEYSIPYSKILACTIIFIFILGALFEIAHILL